MEDFIAFFAQIRGTEISIVQKKVMKAAMILLSFVIGYPVFMMFVYLVAKVIFTPLDKVAAEQEKERFMLLMRARRVRKKERLAHA